MNDLQSCFIKKILSGASMALASEGRAYAPANIALCKYWGKRDAVLNLPMNSSLSVSLGRLGTATTLRLLSGAQDEVLLNGEVVAKEASFARRLSGFLDLFRSAFGGASFRVETENTVPTAAGLASSASGFAALVMALNELGGWQLGRRSLSMLARLGSGSAARSMFDGFAVWHAGRQADGLDSFAEPLEAVWPAFRIGVLELCLGKKPVGSRDGMNRTVETSALYRSWPEQATADWMAIKAAIEQRDFSALGPRVEQNAMAMHATMMSAWPPLIYLRPESLQAMGQVQALRASGVEVYLTMDAGPNVKLIYLEEASDTVRSAFPAVRELIPFGGERDA